MGFQPLPFGSARFGSVWFWFWGFPFGSRPCGMPSAFVQRPSIRYASESRFTKPAGSVQSGTTYRFEAFGLWSLTRPERSILPSCRPLRCSGGSILRASPLGGTASPRQVLGAVAPSLADLDALRLSRGDSSDILTCSSASN